MANKTLFASVKSLFHQKHPTDTVTAEGGSAYAYGAEHALAQIACTGTLQDTFYAQAEQQLSNILDLAQKVDPVFVAKTALFARTHGTMKDVPALLTAWLTRVDPDLAALIFHRVIDNGRMLRTFVQIMRSGTAGRTSLGSRPKRLVQNWLEAASVPALMRAATGKNPSLVDIVRMVHPKPKTAAQRAFYGWLLGKPYDVSALPEEISQFEAWKGDRALPLPPVPFEWLTSFQLSAEEWAQLTERMGWQALRMNLNTLVRNGAFNHDPSLQWRVAAKLSNAEHIANSHVLPYQLYTALKSTGEDIPHAVSHALDQALELSLGNVPKVAGALYICTDVSYSMVSPVTGQRQGATTAVRCVDVAALIAAAFMRVNRTATVIPFADEVRDATFTPKGSLADHTTELANLLGGGTDLAAPLRLINQQGHRVDRMIIVSDNQAWMDESMGDRTLALAEWDQIKARNPRAKLVCIDLQPYGNTQLHDRTDILNVGGFSDAVFDTIDGFFQGRKKRDWVSEINVVKL
jgi:60 kDa SS-A/Ro ribonucleoprotein